MFFLKKILVGFKKEYHICTRKTETTAMQKYDLCFETFLFKRII